MHLTTSKLCSPGRVTYSIQIQMSPVDQAAFRDKLNNVPRYPIMRYSVFSRAAEPWKM